MTAQIPEFKEVKKRGRGPENGHCADGHLTGKRLQNQPRIGVEDEYGQAGKAPLFEDGQEEGEKLQENENDSQNRKCATGEGLCAEQLCAGQREPIPGEKEEGENELKISGDCP